MHYVGIDLHKRTMVVAVEDSERPVGKACSYACQDVAAIRKSMERPRMPHTISYVSPEGSAPLAGTL